MLIDYLVLLSSVVLVVSLATLAYGYRASFWSASLASRYFSRSMAFICLATIGRRGTWDIAWPLLNGHTPQIPDLNLLFNVVCIVAAGYGHAARYYLIPEHERNGWTWLSAWAHPSILTFGPRRK